MRRFTAVLVLTLLASCTESGAQQVLFLDYQAELPASPEPRGATSAMRLAEYTVRRTDDTNAEMIVYYFGEGQGGSADDNIARWSAQFTTADGGPVTPHVTRMSGTAFPTTLAEYEGTYARAIGMGDGAPAKPDQSLVAAVVETPKGNLYLQLFGDRPAVAAVREDFVGMVASIRPESGD
jgi:hypothetical protein